MWEIEEEEMQWHSNITMIWLVLFEMQWRNEANEAK